ncbi:MAG: hypothetical protein C0179_05135, partial [Fervidicoccus sp.]
MSALKKVSCGKFDEIHVKLHRFLKSRNWKRVYHLSSLDEDKDLKRVIELFERNSTIKGSVNNTTIYVIPIYYCEISTDPRKVYVLVAALEIERDISGYIIRIHYSISSTYVFLHRLLEETMEFIKNTYEDFIRLLEKALRIKHPNTPKLIELIDCEIREIRTINLLSRIYGDELLSDEETISGIRNICSRKTEYFINDKVAIIPENINLRIVRDKHNDKIFICDCKKLREEFEEAPQEEKIFYKALFEGYRELLKPKIEVEDPWDNKYVLSSSETEIDGKKILLLMFRRRDPKRNELVIYDILTTSCDESEENKCLVHSIKKRQVYEDIHRMGD